MFKIKLKNKFFLLFFFFSIFLFSKENYLLLTLDTVRTDHLSLYGYEKDTTPFLNSIKNKGVIFKNAYSLVPLTFPSHITILTGKTPLEEGIFLNGQKLEKEENYLPKIFKKYGYRTAGFVSSAILNSMFGISDGFDYFNDVPPEKGEVIKERSCKKTNEEIFKFLKENKEPFFMWVHYFEPHSPYNPPAPYDKEFENPYDGEIRAMDDCVKELFEKIPKNTTIIIAGDHGEMLSEHNEDEHGVLLYEPAIKVPLIILKKGIKAKFRDDYVSLKDIYPTFLSFFEKDKKSLLKEEKEEPILSLTLYGRETFGFYPVYSTIYNGFKLINYGNRDYLLFNLKEDPFEKNNIFSPEHPRLRELKKFQDANPLPETIKIALKDEDKKVLTSLGYSLPKKTERLIHPEVGLILTKDLKKAEEFIKEKKFNEAEKTLLSILQREPNFSEAKRLLGKIYIKSGQTDRAMGAFSSIAFSQMEENPKQMARKKYNEGKIQEAVKIMEEETLLNPIPENFDELAFYYFNSKNFDKLQNLYEKIKSKNISSTGVWSYLGLYFIKENKISEAGELFEKALKLNPKNPESLKGKGIVLYLNKNYEESLKYIENYIGINLRDWEAHYYKGLILKKLGKKEDAKSSFEKAKENCKEEEFIKLIDEETKNL